MSEGHDTPRADWRGMKAVDPSGDKVGTIDEIYVDEETGQPAWAALRTGLFGTRLSFAPLAGARSDGEVVHVAHDKAQIKDAPSVEGGEDLTPADEDTLHRFYGVAHTSEATGARDDAMTRSEEELSVGTSRRAAGTARLRKYVDTEHVETRVPLAHETATLTREPITDANLAKAMDGPEITEAEHEIHLTAEEPVVEKTVVAKERVGLDKELVTEDRTVSEDLRKERIDVQGDVR